MNARQQWYLQIFESLWYSPAPKIIEQTEIYDLRGALFEWISHQRVTVDGEASNITVESGIPVTV